MKIKWAATRYNNGNRLTYFDFAPRFVGSKGISINMVILFDNHIVEDGG